MHYIMKGNLEFSKKKVHFYSLHMKGFDRLLKNEKYFDFEKMDKKNVQNGKAKILLTDRFFQKRV